MLQMFDVKPQTIKWFINATVYCYSCVLVTTFLKEATSASDFVTHTYTHSYTPQNSGVLIFTAVYLVNSHMLRCTTIYLVNSQLNFAHRPEPTKCSQ